MFHVHFKFEKYRLGIHHAVRREITQLAAFFFINLHFFWLVMLSIVALALVTASVVIPWCHYENQSNLQDRFEVR